MRKKERKTKAKDKAVEVVVETKSEKDIGKELAVENQDRKALEAELLQKIPQIFNEAQRRLLLNETPRYVIKQRKGRAGLYYDYVSGEYVIEQLNLLTGFRWDFDVVETNYDDSPDYAIRVGEMTTRGKLVVYGTGKFKGITMSKTATGNHPITYKEGTKEFLSWGNDEKASETDALKRCAKLFGIALDVYSGAVKRAQDENHPEHPITEGQRKRLEALANEAGIGHSGLKKLAMEMYDYQSTIDIQRRHFEAIQQRIEMKIADRVAEPEMPEDVKQGFEILGTPKAKRIATFSAYKSRGEEGLKELRDKMNKEVDKRQSQKEGQKDDKK